MSRDGITPVVAMTLLLFMTVAIAGGAYVWFSGIMQQSQAETTQRLNTELTVKDVQCSGSEVMLALTNTGSTELPGTASVFLYRVADGNLVANRDIDTSPYAFVQPGEFGQITVAMPTLMENERYRVQFEAGEASVSATCDGQPLYFGFDTRKNPPKKTFSYSSIWDVDQSAHASHCGLPCTDWCGDVGGINAKDEEDSGYNRCAPLNGSAQLYIRHSSTATSTAFDLSQLDTATLSFWWRGHSFDGDDEKAEVYVYDGSSWTQVICMEGGNDGVDNGCVVEDDVAWHKETVDISPYLNDQFRVRVQGSPGSWDDLWVDSMRITQ
ncbi:MAG: hypothetical protein SVY41_02945 [Candidatus Nanohaloarchaea archaeon]|nr:hypothetical protein [Candidatus Nanohaloarchaea archaeon]